MREILLRTVETSVTTNSFFLGNISNRNKIGEDLTSLFHLPDYYNKLNPAVVQAAARTYLNTDNYVQVELFPEKR